MKPIANLNPHWSTFNTTHLFSAIQMQWHIKIWLITLMLIIWNTFSINKLIVWFGITEDMEELKELFNPNTYNKMLNKFSTFLDSELELKEKLEFMEDL